MTYALSLTSDFTPITRILHKPGYALQTIALVCEESSKTKGGRQGNAGRTLTSSQGCRRSKVDEKQKEKHQVV